MKARGIRIGPRLGVVAMALGSVLAWSCAESAGGGEGRASLASLAKITPAAVAVVEGGEADGSAWRMFDRSTVDGWSPGGERAVRVTLTRAFELRALKVFGPAPFVLTVEDLEGDGIDGWRDVDLSGLDAGWNTLFSDAPIGEQAVVLRLRPTGSSGAIPEIELWGRAARPSRPVDADRLYGLFASGGEIPGTLDVIGTEDRLALDAGDRSTSCGTVRFTLVRPPRTYRAAHLVYQTENVFRPFVLERGLNGRPLRGGEWLSGYEGPSLFVEAIDPRTLRPGVNELHVCLPRDAEGRVELRDLRLVGELESGANFVDSAILGSLAEPRDGSAAIDGTTTGVSVTRRAPLVVFFERLVTPDVVAIETGGATTPWELECLGSDEAWYATSTEQRDPAADGAGPALLHVEAPGAACAALRLTPGGATTVQVAEVEVVGSGARRPVDWPRIHLASAREHFGEVAWVEGWVDDVSGRPGATRVELNGAQSERLDGTYQMLLHRDSEVHEPWPVTVAARMPDGQEVTRVFVLDRDASAELEEARDGDDDPDGGPVSDDETRYGREGDRVEKTIDPDEGGKVRLGTHVGVDVPPGAVDRPTTIGIEHLGRHDLPPLDPALINVTAPEGHAYEFTPHGQRFLKPVTVMLPYDHRLLPQGYTPNDVHTYYYDDKQERWVQLDRAEVDTEMGVLRSLTDHFTIMINAVLTVPENPSPQLFDPTSISSLAAGNPKSNIDMIQPPKPTSTGAGNLTFPIRVPPGRGAYTPELSIDYSSSGGNGWLGVGWDLRVSRIEVDTRFGAATYDGSERYLLDGTQLVPTGETDGPGCTVGSNEQRYRPRVEGAFAHILRCGSNPSTYHWEVWDKSGTLYVYGDHSEGAAGTTQNAKANLSDPRGGNIYAWHLRKVRDTNGNLTTFTYGQDSDQIRPEPDDGEPFTQVYLEKITYTDNNGVAPQYEIVFQRDDGGRPDHVITGRPGFKVETRHLLRGIRISFNGQLIRQYGLTYWDPRADGVGADPTDDEDWDEGQVRNLGKSLLRRITVYGTGGCDDLDGDPYSLPDCEGSEFYSHEFDYWDEEENLGAVETWDAPVPLGITEARSTGGAGHVYFGIGFNPSKDPGLGQRLGLSGNRRTQQVAMIDINGDGLPDQLYEAGTEKAVLLNAYDPANDPCPPGSGMTCESSGMADSRALLDGAVPSGDPGFGQATFPVSGLNQLGWDRSFSFNSAFQGWYRPLEVGVGFGHSRTAGLAFLTDLNGDGFIDYVNRREGSRFSSRCEVGSLQGVCFGDLTLTGLDAIDPSQDSSLEELESAVEDDFFMAAPVRKWVAPFSGFVRVHASYQRTMVDGTPEADGVEVHLYATDASANASVADTVIDGCPPPGDSCQKGQPCDPEPNPCRAGPDDLEVHDLTGENGLLRFVSAGDALYMKVSSIDAAAIDDTTMWDLVNADMFVEYTSLGFRSVTDDQRTMSEPTGEPLFSYDGAQDFRVAGSPAPVFSAPADGHLTLDAALTKPTYTTDDLRVCVQLIRTHDEDGEELDVVETDLTCAEAEDRDYVEVTPVTDIAWDGTGEYSVQAAFDVVEGDLFVVRVESDLTYDPQDLSFSLVNEGLVYAEPPCDAESCPKVGVPESGCEGDNRQTCPVHPMYALPNTEWAGVPEPWVAEEDGEVRIVATTDIQDEAGIFSVRSTHPDRHVLHKEELDASCAGIPCGRAFLKGFFQPIEVEAGESLWFEASTLKLPEHPLIDDQESVEGTAVVYFRVNEEDPWTSFEVPISHVRRRLDDEDPFSGGYRGWRYGAWNDQHPFEPSLLEEKAENDRGDADDFEGDFEEADEDERRGLTSQERETLRFLTMAPRPGGTDLTAQLSARGDDPAAWVAGDETIFLTSSFAHSARAGGRSKNNDGLDTDLDIDSGLRPEGYSRLSVSTSAYISAGVSEAGAGANLSLSTGHTRTTTDVMDVNGDGIADTVTDHGIVLGSLPRDGRRATGGRSDHDTDGAFRERVSTTYNAGALGPNPPAVEVSSGGRPLAVSTRMPGVGLSLARNRTQKDLIDLNGDGLPDRVERDGGDVRVRLNLGDRFGDPDVYSADAFDGDVDKFPDIIPRAGKPNAIRHESTVSVSTSVGGSLSDGKAEFGASLTLNSSATHTVSDLADINGDGLPDLLFKKDGKPIKVQYNLGGKFGEARDWNPPDWDDGLLDKGENSPFALAPSQEVASLVSKAVGPDVLAGTGRLSADGDGFEAGAYFSVYFPVPPFAPVIWIIVNAGGSVHIEKDAYEMALMDIDGNGSADHVFRRPDLGGKLYVKRNQISGKMNLLKTVQGPLGSRIELDYERTANTVDDPQSRMVLSEVRVDDGVQVSDGEDFASPAMLRQFDYEGGFYDRAEKEFFGFSKVVQQEMRETSGDPVALRSTVRLYENGPSVSAEAYALKGRMTDEYVFAGAPPATGVSGAVTHRHTEWEAVPVKGPGGELGRDPDCVEVLHPLLGDHACDTRFARVKTTSTTIHESGGSKTRVEEELEYDRFGNILRSLDHADDATSEDDVYAVATYSYQERPEHLSRWIVDRPASLEVYGGGIGGTLLRSRSGSYSKEGNLTEVEIQTDAAGGAATTTLTYDSYGNIETVTLPPNENTVEGGKSTQSYTLDYDELHQQHVTSVKDVFEYESTKTYHPVFRKPLVTTDINGNTMTRSYDEFGRLDTVKGPYDGVNASVDIDYFHRATHPYAETINRASPPAGYTGDVPADLKTVTVVDGLGRTLQVRKSATVENAAGMPEDGLTTADMVSYDALGREVERYHPFFDAGATGGYGAPSGVPPSTKLFYDVRDRVTKTEFPDGTEATTTYSVQQMPGGGRMFHKAFRDANGHLLETYSDLMKRTVAVVEHPDEQTSALTRYTYLATGELDTITDADGNKTVLGYDLRGLNILLHNPDTGLITQEYDPMGNVVARQDPNHRALGADKKIQYRYNADRLEQIAYPGSKPGVSFEFGGPDAEHNRAGRIYRIDDETGRVERFFGALGEVRKEVRTVTQVPPGREPVVLTTQTTFDSLGRLLELVYPDGERLAHAYDGGGNLRSVTGHGVGFEKTYVSELHYDVFGNRVHALFGNEVESRWSFDAEMVRLETARTTLLDEGPAVQDLSYEYDPVGNPKQIRSNLPVPAAGDHRLPGGGEWNFTYDGVDRLTHADGFMDIAPGKRNRFEQDFAYSKIHNIENKSRVHVIENPGDSGGEVTPPHTNFDYDYEYDPGRPHQAVKVGDLLQKYDPSGNVIERTREGTGKTRHLTWDDDGRLVEVKQAGSRQRNWYDSEGKRVIKRSRYGETIFANQYFDLRNGVQANKHVFAGSMRVATVLSHFNAGAYRGGGGNGGGGGGGSSGSAPGQGDDEPPGQGGGDPPGHAADPPDGHSPPGHDGSAGGGNGSGNGSGGSTGSGDFRPGGAGQPPPPSRAGHPFYFHADHLGSTTVLTDPDGEVHEHLQYFPDGDTWIERGPRRPVNGYKFSGKFMDPETGFYDFGQRFYDPRTSLWLSVDPQTEESPKSWSTDPVVLSFYSYAGQNPIVFVDPDGRKIVLAMRSRSQRQKVLGSLQQLTDDTLHIVGSEIKVKEPHGGGSRPRGTSLMRELVETEKTVDIRATRDRPRFRVGKGGDATIWLNLSGKDAKGQRIGALVEGPDGRATAQPVSLAEQAAHELTHALRAVRGETEPRSETATHVFIGRQGRVVTKRVLKEELETVGFPFERRLVEALRSIIPGMTTTDPDDITENAIRREQGLPERVDY